VEGTLSFHALLRRQWRRFLGSEEPVPDKWRTFLQAVSDAYGEFDAGRILVERALELSSKELHDANAELRGVLQVLPDLLFRVQADNRLCPVMQGGGPVWEEPALRDLALLSSDHTSSPAQQFWRCIEQVRHGRTVISFEYSTSGDSQSPFYEMRLLPFVGDDLIGIVRDVTLRVQAERALRDSEARSALAQQAGHVGVYDWNLATEEVFWSGEAEEIFGLQRGNFAGTYARWRERVVEDDRMGLDAFFSQWLGSQREDDCWEYRVVHADQQEHWVESKGHVFRDANRRPLRIIGTHLDITARKQAEQDRLVLGKLESTGILAGGIAHDFNNLLSGMLMNIEIAKSSELTARELREVIEETEAAVLAAKHLTQQLITFARGGSGIRQSTDLGSLLQESMPLALSGSSVRGELVIAPDLWPADVNGGQIGQVIRNLVLNAREAMPNGGVVTLRAKNVALGPSSGVMLPAGDYVQIEVADQGTGILPEVLPKIFDPYFSTKTRGAQKGMGLGLTICHSVVKKHAGAITVGSSAAGTTFDVYLPASSRGGLGWKSTKDNNSTWRGRVLIMDDEPTLRARMGKVLEQVGCEVGLAADGERAISLYLDAKERGQPYDVVILDLTVRGAMGGRDAARALLVCDPSARILVMSGHSDDDVMRDYPKYGFVGALVKPFDRTSLLDRLDFAMKSPAGNSVPSTVASSVGTPGTIASGRR
jgi:PAS domain S-box-containing protein